MSGPDFQGRMEDSSECISFEGAESIYYEASSFNDKATDYSGGGRSLPTSTGLLIPAPLDKRNRALSTPGTFSSKKNAQSTAISSSIFPSTSSLPFEFNSSYDTPSPALIPLITTGVSTASEANLEFDKRHGLESIERLLSFRLGDANTALNKVYTEKLMERSQGRREENRQARERANRKSSLAGVDGYSVDLISFMDRTSSANTNVCEGSTSNSTRTTARTSLRPAATSPPSIRPRRRRPVTSPQDITDSVSTVSAFFLPPSPHSLSFPSSQVDMELKSTNLAPSPVIIPKGKFRGGSARIYTRSSVPSINILPTSPFTSQLEIGTENLPPASSPMVKEADGRHSKFRKSNSTSSLRKVAKSVSRLPASLPSRTDSATVTSNADPLSPCPVLSLSGSFSSQPFINTQTWRSTLSIESYKNLLSVHGGTEMKRQEVIHELITTEQSFVQGLQSILSIFVLPLRSTTSFNSDLWVAGIPLPIARLFDWLEDIVYLHSEILTALESLRSKSSSVIFDLASTLLPFISELEVYQPYLIRLEAVTNAIDSMTKDVDSEFGKYVRSRMRSYKVDCGALSLGSWLLKPVQRLMKYPLFFKVSTFLHPDNRNASLTCKFFSVQQLCLLTPLSHSDYTSVNSLLQSTEFLLHSMQEVKARSDEYEDLLLLETQIQGLPDHFRLASRERRIINRGSLNQVHMSNKDHDALKATQSQSNLVEIPQTPTPSTTATLTPASTQSSSPIASSRPYSEVSVFSQSSQESTPGSLYYSSENSTGTVPTSDYNSSPPTPDSSSMTRGSSTRRHLLSMKSLMDFSTSHYLRSTKEDASDTGKVESRPSSRSKTVPRINRAKVLRTRAKETELIVFIFSDLLLFTSQIDEAGSPFRYKVLEGMGLSKLETLVDLSGKTGKYILKGSLTL